MDTQIAISIGVLFAAVASAMAAVGWFLTDPQLSQRRLTTFALPGVVSRKSLLTGGIPANIKRVRSFVPRSPKEMNRLQRLMAAAGYEGPWPATIYAIAQLTLAGGLFLLVLGYVGGGMGLLAAFLTGAIGYYVPSLWLGSQINKRKREIQNGLPDAIDLLIVCIESGSGIDQALNRVAEELALPYPALARELDLISAETRAGRPRIEAFKNFAERTKVDDVRSLVAMLVQTDRFGTSIGLALRTHAETSRTKRRQRAEERAAKLAVKLLFPLVFCLFPSFYVIVLGPAMLSVFRQFVFGIAAK